MEIMKANKQWASRPADERFETLEDLHAAAVKLESEQREYANVDPSTLRTVAEGDDVVLVGKGNTPARLTHWAFGQLAARIGAPASYLRDLPAGLAVQNINHGLAARAQDAAAGALAMLVHYADRLTINALTSTRYERIWNREVTERLLGLKARGWDVAKPDLSLGAVTVDDGRRPLYASDRDIFAFVCSQNTVDEPGNPDGLLRGVIVENSTVGASKLRLTRFLYRGMCGNHIIWDASDVSELALAHRGNIRERVQAWDLDLTRYVETSATEDEARIASAKSRIIAATKDEVLDALFGARIPALSRRVLDAAYDAVVPDEDGAPNTVWGIVQGITRYSQTVPYADARTDIDRAAGRILDVF